MQILILHGLSEKGEQKIIAKMAQNPPINTPPISSDFGKKIEKISQTMAEFF